MVVDWVMRQSTAGQRTGIQWTFTKQLEDLNFADDISLLSHRQQDTQDNLLLSHRQQDTQDNLLLSHRQQDTQDNLLLSHRQQDTQDNLLLSHRQQDTQEKLCRAAAEAEKTGLRINIGKTEAMRVHNKQNDALRLHQENIKEVDKFVYLGNVVSKDGGTD